MSCTHMAVSVAMVIYAHMPQWSKPPGGGLDFISLETEFSVMESEFNEAPKWISYESEHHIANDVELETCPRVLERWGLIILANQCLQSPSHHVTAERSNIDAL